MLDVPRCWEKDLLVMADPREEGRRFMRNHHRWFSPQEVKVLSPFRVGVRAPKVRQRLRSYRRWMVNTPKFSTISPRCLEELHTSVTEPECRNRESRDIAFTVARLQLPLFKSHPAVLLALRGERREIASTSTNHLSFECIFILGTKNRKGLDLSPLSPSGCKTLDRT